MLSVTANGFLEDTSVLVAGAFVLVRGPLERVASKPIGIGLLAGILGVSESVFPEARYPYAPHTLACAFATALGGWRAGLVAGVLTVLSAAAILPGWESVAILVQTACVTAVTAVFSRYIRSVWWSLIPASIGQSLAIQLTQILRAPLHATLTSYATIPANAFGLALLLLVVSDARLRAEAEERRHERDEARRVAAEAQLAMLRSRVQPHFLFNALNAIAALCSISPPRAADATVKLGKLMRRSLEIDFGRGLTLAEEMETVRSYIAIEQERFGPKFRIRFEYEPCSDVVVPAFSVQILVENAILHGISQKAAGGEVVILAKRRENHCVIAVFDDGPGIVRTSRSPESPHGLEILRQQLRASFGSAGRFHVLARRCGGTVAAFHVPLPRGSRG